MDSIGRRVLLLHDCGQYTALEQIGMAAASSCGEFISADIAAASSCGLFISADIPRANNSRALVMNPRIVACLVGVDVGLLSRVPMLEKFGWSSE